MRMFDSRVRRFATLATLAMSLCLTSCNSRSPVFENGAGVVATPAAPTPSVPVPALVLSLSPPALMGGGSAVGNITISVAAASAGRVLMLSSSDPTVVVPPSVTVPEGRIMTSFPLTTQRVSADRQVVISASIPGRSVPAILNLWAEVPMSFSFVSDPGHVVGRGEFRRFTASNAAFGAVCQASWVRVQVNGTGPDGSEFWFATFGAPRGTPMRVGTYENAVDGGVAPGFPSTSGPVLDVSGNGAGCSAVGRFVVSEVDVAANGTVRRFRASFEQQCQTRNERLTGDVSITNAAPVQFITACTVR